MIKAWPRVLISGRKEICLAISKAEPTRFADGLNMSRRKKTRSLALTTRKMGFP